MKARSVLAVTVATFFAGSVLALAQDTAQVERGLKVYTDQKCAVCHSIAGKGNAKGKLEGVGTRLKADEIREWLVDPAAMTKKTNAERKPPMRAFAKLSKEDLDGLVAYLSTLKQ